jgi:hypothetical protein
MLTKPQSQIDDPSAASRWKPMGRPSSTIVGKVSFQAQATSTSPVAMSCASSAGSVQ